MRMYRAVQAKLRNSELTTYDALKLGGFEFILPTQTNAPKHMTDATLRDSDGISLSQRKHQFRRRLRLIERKTEPTIPTTRQFEGNLDDDDGTRFDIELSRDHGYHQNAPLDYACQKNLLSEYQTTSVSLNSQSNDRMHGSVDHMTYNYRCMTDVLGESHQSAIRTDTLSCFRTNYDDLTDHNNIPRERAQVGTHLSMMSDELKPSSLSDRGLERRMSDACLHYLNASPSLLKQSMILAGFELQETDCSSEAFQRIFESIVIHETKLLTQLLSNAPSSNTGPPNIDYAPSSIRANEVHNGEYLYKHTNEPWSYGHSGLYDVRYCHLHKYVHNVCL